MVVRVGREYFRVKWVLAAGGAGEGRRCRERKGKGEE